MKRKIKNCFFKKHSVFPILRAQTKHRINKVFPEKGGKAKHEKATRSILSTVLAVSMAAAACPVSFAATTSNEVTAREKANAALAREAAAQGMVLLENKNNSLPIKTKKLALFGGGAVRTVRGGTGSGDPFNGGLSGGGDVNVNQSERYNINIYNSFKKAGYDITTASILGKICRRIRYRKCKSSKQSDGNLCLSGTYLHG